MKLVKHEYLIRIFNILTKRDHKVEFVVNDENTVVMEVFEDNYQLISSTLFSVHNSKEEANNAKKTYEATFAVYRHAMDENSEIT